MDQRRKRIIVTAGSVVATLIAAAVIIVPIVANSGKTTSSPDSVEVTAGGSEVVAAVSPYATATVIGELTRPVIRPEQNNFWRIPVDAPFSTMPPVEQYGQCGAEQLAWLAEHAAPGRMRGEAVTARVRNGADTGASLSIANIHAEGEFVERSQVVELQCSGVGGGGSQIIELTLDGTPGVWGEATPWDEKPQPQGVEAVLNLAPGEIAELIFDIAGETKQFNGRIVADITSPEPGAVVLVDSFEFPSDPMPGYYLSYANGGLTCIRPTGRVECTPAEAEVLLREAGRL